MCYQKARDLSPGAGFLEDPYELAKADDALALLTESKDHRD
jgi:hypothetical protein